MSLLGLTIREQNILGGATQQNDGDSVKYCFGLDFLWLRVIVTWYI